MSHARVPDVPLVIVHAGLHSLSIGRQMAPLSSMLGWYILVSNCTFGGLKG